MKLKSCLNDHEGLISCLALDSEEKYLLSGGYDKCIRLWSLNTNAKLVTAPIKKYSGHGYQVFDINVSSDNSRFVSCGGDKCVLLWDVITGKVLNRFYGHSQRINSVAFMSANDDRVIVSGSYDATVRIYDHREHFTSNRYHTNSALQVLHGAKDSITKVHCGLPNTIISCSVDGMVRCFDIRKGELTSDNVFLPVTWLESSTEGKFWLINVLPGQLYFIERKTGKLVNTFRGHINESYQLNCQFSTLDKRIFSGSEDGKIYFWDYSDSEPKGSFVAHENSIVTRISITSNGNLLTAGNDGKIKIFNVE